MDTDPNLGLALLAAVLAAATALATLVSVWRTRPRHPAHGPSTDELGPEPPAIVNLLTEDFAVTPAAVPATVLDLAVRKWLAVEEVAGANVVIRLQHQHPDDALTAYEKRVLDHLAGLAVDGVVPAEAMTTGAGDSSTRWWRGFRREVIADAHGRGLCRDRFPKSSLAPLGTGVLAAGAALWLAEKVGTSAGAGHGLARGSWIAGIVVTAAVAALITWLPGRDLQRDTDAGRAAAARWLGVRDHLRAVGDFGDKPAASVVVWDRYLGVAVALDLAPVALAQLPLGSEDDRRCWSRATGTWRRVRVRYPWLRPGYGQHPALAVVGALAVGAVAALVLLAVARVLNDDVKMVEDLPRGAAGVVDWIASGVGVVAVIVIGWNLVKLLAGLADLVQVDTVSGVLLRRRVRWGLVGLHEDANTGGDSRGRNRYFCAVDAGRAPTVVAWRVRPTIYGRVREGGPCRVQVTRSLRYVRSLDPVGDAPTSAPPT